MGQLTNPDVCLYEGSCVNCYPRCWQLCW